MEFYNGKHAQQPPDNFITTIANFRHRFGAKLVGIIDLTVGIVGLIVFVIGGGVSLLLVSHPEVIDRTKVNYDKEFFDEYFATKIALLSLACGVFSMISTVRALALLRSTSLESVSNIVFK